jgi:hypothetical protein
MACCARSSPSCGLTPRRAGLLPDLGAAADARRKDAQTAFGRGGNSGYDEPPVAIESFLR